MMTGNGEPSDEVLLARIAAGDREAFTLLFRRHKTAIYRFAAHMTGSSAAADDVTQEVFLTVMRDAGRFDGSRGSAIAWLCGIARNHVRRLLDGHARHESLTEESVPEQNERSGSDPLSDLARIQRVAALRLAVRSLPLRYREAVVLCDLQELSYADAASAIGCAVGTIRSRVHRGRALLAVKLRETQATSDIQVRNRRCFA